jgi:hypothetical protein
VGVCVCVWVCVCVCVCCVWERDIAPHQSTADRLRDVPVPSRSIDDILFSGGVCSVISEGHLSG